MAPLRIRRIRLRHAAPDDTEWLRATLDRAGRGLGGRIRSAPDGMLALVADRAGRTAAATPRPGSCGTGLLVVGSLEKDGTELRGVGCPLRTGPGCAASDDEVRT